MTLDVFQGGPNEGIAVVVATGSPAAKAGIQSADKITQLNSRRIQNVQEILEAVYATDLSKGLQMSLLRGGKQVEAALPGDVFEGVFGPRATLIRENLYEVGFRYRPAKQAKEVYLAGSFNDWKPTGHRMQGPDKEGWYITRLELNTGVHEYKFVVDGTTWESDPENVFRAGTYQNSLLFVGVRP